MISPMNPWSSLDAEKCVLGAMLQADHAVSAAVALLPSEAFYKAEHREIFKAMQALHAERKAVDLVTASESLEARGTLDGAGGAVYLVELTQHTPTTVNVRAYIDIVKEHYERRRLAKVGEQLQRYAANDEYTPAEIISKARTDLRGIGQGSADIVTISDVLMRTYLAMERRMSGEDVPISIGIPAIDKAFYGFVPGELTVIGARPGVGKSALAGHIAVKAARRGKRVCIVSLEMSDIQYGQRLLAHRTGVDSQAIRSAAVSTDDLTLIISAMSDMAALPLEFMFTGRQLEHISAAVQQRIDNEGLDLLIIDYLQLLETAAAHKSNYERITHISRSLKEMTISMGIPVIALAQLNRAATTRMDKTPAMHDLRDSGAIEQDADNILLLHRPDGPEDEGVDRRDREYFNNFAVRGYQYLRLGIEKQRQGVVGCTHVLFAPKTMQYIAIDREGRA